ncbi:unnamed protein product [Protopolystoma xenopodis]|uniref:Peptidase C1A papain C-terminal domain-containing protein n=1 Tax=Protopolystoma xenopodis TaxID=117903 RepID=A0A3S4ZX00_9PLAT|nr:unnamed protein product [Protopolystoma xenopodis]
MKGNCGSCYAFSACGSLEGQYKKKTDKLIDFSTQQVVDCSSEEGNMFCNGGLQDYSFNYMQKHGITSEEKYPYIGKVSKA